MLTDFKVPVHQLISKYSNRLAGTRCLAPSVTSPRVLYLHILNFSSWGLAAGEPSRAWNAFGFSCHHSRPSSKVLFQLSFSLTYPYDIIGNDAHPLIHLPVTYLLALSEFQTQLLKSWILLHLLLRCLIWPWPNRLTTEITSEKSDCPAVPAALRFGVRMHEYTFTHPFKLEFLIRNRLFPDTSCNTTFCKQTCNFSLSFYSLLLVPINLYTRGGKKKPNSSSVT